MGITVLWGSNVPLALGAIIFIVTISCILIKSSWSLGIPAPFLARYTKLWYAWHIHHDDLHWANIELHRRKGEYKILPNYEVFLSKQCKHADYYTGKIVQVMPGYFIIDDPEAHKVVYGLGNAWLKGEFYDAWKVGADPNHNNLFATRNPAQHSEMRRKVASMYSMTSMVSYEPYVDLCIELLVAQLEESATTINVGAWLQYFAFDAISMITFGQRMGFLDKGSDVENMIENLNFDHMMLTYASLYPWTTPYVRMLSSLISGPKIHFFMRFASEKITAARQETQDLPADGPAYMVRKFLDAQRKEGKKGMTDWDVSANAGANIGAGSDTTAIALTSIVYYVYRDARVLGRLRQEISGSELSGRPTFQDTQKLPYMQAVIKEAVRVQPGVGLPLWREVPKGGAVVCGQFFPERVNIGVNPWVPHHNKEVFGVDADEFRPERWLEASSEKLAKMEQSMVHFGLGSRTCIGKNVSLLEINKLIPVLVRNFDLSFCDKHGDPENRDYVPVRNKWFIKVPQLYARVTKRGAVGK
ncbi:cytochrome P450 [Cryphonectria parasitica EP155]|uniref:Cytochrome P450 n=1 Tax=Cryphonectria parasitica (strain ATCC 38755 / EP155) TaxID=660469 RepID=A0A9P4XY97_CRYP1|nr:cytochrome P450 [Cryphonectria parasitica EP155]KAF3763002.1 cytochrome P450 [Cryphonectria parasitica EP155]